MASAWHALLITLEQGGANEGSAGSAWVLNRTSHLHPHWSDKRCEARITLEYASLGQATLRCLGSNGRLLEIGKYDILKGTPLSMRPLLRNIAFEGIDLDRILNDPTNMEEVTAQSIFSPSRGCSSGFMVEI